MTQFFNYMIVILFCITLLFLIVLTNNAKFKSAKQKQEKQDLENFGRACGLNTCHCYFIPEIDQKDKNKIKK